MTLMRESLFCNWTDYETSSEVLDEFKFTKVFEKMNEIKSKWTNRVNSISHNILPRIFLERLYQKTEEIL